MSSTFKDLPKRVAGAVIGAITVALLRVVRLFDPVSTSNTLGAITRRIGPLLPEHRTGRANLKAAFPEKSPQEIEAILLTVWENLGRLGAEFAHLDRIWDLNPSDA